MIYNEFKNEYNNNQKHGLEVVKYGQNSQKESVL